MAKQEAMVGLTVGDPFTDKRQVLTLGDDFYAVKFGYHAVNWHTIGMAIPSQFLRKFGRHEVRFAEEKPAALFGKRRADSEVVAHGMPAEVAVLRTMVGEAALGEYVIFKVVKK